MPAQNSVPRPRSGRTLSRSRSEAETATQSPIQPCPPPPLNPLGRRKNRKKQRLYADWMLHSSMEAPMYLAKNSHGVNYYRRPITAVDQQFWRGPCGGPKFGWAKSLPARARGPISGHKSASALANARSRNRCSVSSIIRAVPSKGAPVPPSNNRAANSASVSRHLNQRS